MLTRMEELTVQAANGTYSETDKKNIQAEIDQLKEAINHISSTTKFNGINVFKSSTSTTQINLIFAESVADYTTLQTPSGSNTTTGYDPDFINQVETELVPNAIKTLLSAYPAFGYLSDSSIGIGLELYNDSSSNTLASVSCGIQGYLLNNNINMTYTLSINMASVDWNAATNTITNRSEFESVIAHKMTHALMDEALTSGMFGLTDTGTDAPTRKFPLWFVEGLAQAASGPGNWLNSDSINLSTTSSNDEIKNALSQLSSNSNAGNYGAGYLATTYLGHLVSSSAGPATASTISTGLNKILSSLISGHSLNDVIKENTKYTTLTDFVANFKNDTEAYDFTRTLISQRGAGLGSVITGDLSDDDVLDDNKVTINLFKVNPNTSAVINNYTGIDITVISGGSAITPGTSATADAGSYPGSGSNPNPSPNPDPSPNPNPNPAPGPSIPPTTITLDAINFKIGEGADEVITYDVPTLSTESLGIDTLDVLTNPDTNSVKNAIEKVSTIRGHLGALQNRLEHTYKNLMNTVENLTAAESRIRDADMAKEMMEFSKNNILVQVDMTLLAQANSMPNNVLQLLRS